MMVATIRSSEASPIYNCQEHGFWARVTTMQLELRDPIAPVLGSFRIEGGVGECNVAINVGLGIQDLEDPSHHATPVGPVTFFFVQGLDGGCEDR